MCVIARDKLNIQIENNVEGKNSYFLMLLSHRNGTQLTDLATLPGRFISLLI